MSSESERSEGRSKRSAVSKVITYRRLVLVLARGLIELGDTGRISESVRRDCADFTQRTRKSGES